MADEVRLILKGLIEEIAQESVFSETDTVEGRKEFLDFVKSKKLDKKAKSAIFYNDVISKFTSYIELADMNNVRNIIEAGVQFLHDAVEFPGTKKDWKDKIKSIINSFENLSGGDVDVLLEERSSDLPIFIQSSCALLEDLERDLLSLDIEPQNKTNFADVCRAIHTLKGEAALVGVSNISKLAHNTETILESIREGKMQMASNCITLLLKIVDKLKIIIAELQVDPSAALKINIDEEIEVLNSLSYSDNKISDSTVMENDILAGFKPKIPSPDMSMGEDMLTDFLSESREHVITAEQALLTLESEPENMDQVNVLFRAFHTIKGLAGFLNLEDLKIITHDTESMMDFVRKGKLPITHSVMDAAFQALDSVATLLDLIEEQLANCGKLNSPYSDISLTLIKVRSIVQSIDKEDEEQKIGEILVRQGVVSEDRIEEALLRQEEEGHKRRVGEVLLEEGIVSREQLNQGLQQQKKGVVLESSIKIGLAKLDALIDMVGELVITGTQVAQNPTIKNSNDTRLSKDVAQFDRIVRDIQGIAMSMRLVPIKPVFQKMLRVVRDLSKKSGKDIDILLMGESTEIDKNIVDLINDPLMHMVRNSADHGIESPEERIKAGKKPKGKVILNAYHRGGNIVIEIKDDGKGLDKKKIRDKAIDRGIVDADTHISDKEIFNLIFEPGFSTAEQVTDVSGRGVGMDVVRRNIEGLRGKIEIESEEGKGTVFYIKLPLTLAIIDGIVLRVGSEKYIVPIFSVLEFIQPKEEYITRVVGKGELIDVHGESIKVIRVHEIFSFFDAKQDLEEMVGCVVESEGGKVCLLVDELLGQQQVVIKGLNERFKEVKGLAGATILGDGKVGLILDMNGIVNFDCSGVLA